MVILDFWSSLPLDALELHIYAYKNSNVKRIMQKFVLKRLGSANIWALTCHAPCRRSFAARTAVTALPTASPAGSSLWPAHWAAIEEMRLSRRAPVDLLGDTTLAYGAGAGSGGSSSSPQERASFRFRTLIATMLSPQTKDAQTAQAFNNLEQAVQAAAAAHASTGIGASPAAFESGFSAAALLALSPAQVEKACAPVSFYKTKAVHILKACAEIERRQYMHTSREGSSELAGMSVRHVYNALWHVKNQMCTILIPTHAHPGIPTDITDMLTYSGVGPKIAYLTFSIAWGRDEGICVDTHVHRIANRLRWVGKLEKERNGEKEKETFKESAAAAAAEPAAAQPVLFANTSNAEKTRLQLQQLLPLDKWGKVNELLVGFGQTICSAQAPRCDQCTIREVRQCAWYKYMRKRDSGSDGGEAGEGKR